MVWYGMVVSPCLTGGVVSLLCDAGNIHLALLLYYSGVQNDSSLEREIPVSIVNQCNVKAHITAQYHLTSLTSTQYC